MTRRALRRPAYVDPADRDAAPTLPVGPRCIVCRYLLLTTAEQDAGQCAYHCVRCHDPLWAPQSISRGYCEACALDEKHGSRRDRRAAS